jgi:DivIVA domain-containing protein
VPDSRPIPISSHPNLDPDAISGREFPVTWRGYDPEAVHRFLVDVAQLVRLSRAKQRELTDRLHDAERRAAEPELDEETLSAALGSETARVIHVAHAAANEVLSKAEARAAQIVAEAEAAGHELRRRAELEAAAIVNETRGAANATIDAAKEDCRAMIDESREVRRRILSDLAERRRVYYSQIEQLRAGKDALSSVVAHVSDTIAAVRARLEGSENDARAAAEVARRATELEPGPGYSRGEVAEPAEVASVAGGVEGLDAADEVAGSLAAAFIGPADEGVTAADREGTRPEGAAVDQAVVAGDASGAAIVDELFARIREASSTPAPPPEAAPVPAQGAPEGDGAVDTESGGVAPGGGGASASGAPTDASVPAGLRVGDVTLERNVLLRRRDELIERPLGELVHVLKRALRVEQNDLLHLLREAPRGTEPETLTSLSDEAQRFAQAASPALSVVWQEGARFARERLSSTGRASSTGASDDAACRAATEVVATSLGTEISTAITTRLVQSFRAGDGEAESLQHAVGAAYRDWKGERIEDTAGDYATRAFALGTLEVARSEGMAVSWVVDDGASRCSDCDDNELAGLLEPGVTFPTGQPQPPAHGGCRCVLVPAGP